MIDKFIKEYIQDLEKNGINTKSDIDLNSVKFFDFVQKDDFIPFVIRSQIKDFYKEHKQ